MAQTEEATVDNTINTKEEDNESTSQMSEKKGIKFIINDGDPTDIVYLNDTNCQELLRVATEKLTSEQLKNNTFVIKDEAGVIYGEDDEDLIDAYEDIDSDDEQVLVLSLNLIPNKEIPSIPPSIEKDKPEDNLPSESKSEPQEPIQPSENDKLDKQKPNESTTEKPTANISDDTKEETNNEQQPKQDHSDTKEDNTDNKDAEQQVIGDGNDAEATEDKPEANDEQQPKQDDSEQKAPTNMDNIDDKTDSKEEVNHNEQPPKQDDSEQKTPSNDANDTVDNTEPKEDNYDNKDAEQQVTDTKKDVEPIEDEPEVNDEQQPNQDDSEQKAPSNVNNIDDETGTKEETNNNEQKTPSNDANDTVADNKKDASVIEDEPEVKQYEISEEEKNVYILITNEKEFITKCIDRMVQSLAKFETNSDQKKTIINDTFDSLINTLNNRKTALLNELNNEILTQKSDVLKQIESIKKYQHTLDKLDVKYKTLTNPEKDGDEKVDIDQGKHRNFILSMPEKFNAKFSKMEFAADIKVRLDTDPLETAIKSFGSVRIGKVSDPDYDEEKVPSFIDDNLEILLAQIPIKRIYRWGKRSGAEETWKSRAQRTIISFYQNKQSYKVRMVVKENESEDFLMNQWVHTNELVEMESLVWEWSSFDATIAKEEGDEKKGYTKWCAKFFDDTAFERFQDQYNQAKKINIQVLENEEKIRKNKLQHEKLRKEEEVIESVHDEEADVWVNDEKLCYEMDVYKIYLWGKDAAGKGAWKSYAQKSMLQFFENRKNKKIRIVLRENETKQLKLNHWIPTDVSLKSRGDQMWEWQVYDDLATKFLKNSTLKLATICGTFIDKKDTHRFKELFEKYQKINQQAEAL